MKERKAMASRRDFMRRAGAGTAFVAIAAVLSPRISTAAGHLPKVDVNDPTAKALEYTHESSKEGQQCNSCQLWQGGDKDWGGCAIFPGKEVSAKGWCKSWVKRTT